MISPRGTSPGGKEDTPANRTTRGGARRSGDDPIKHVIVLMLENRSFDQMLGALQKVYPDLDGAEAGGSPRVNRDPEGQRGGADGTGAAAPRRLGPRLGGWLCFEPAAAGLMAARQARYQEIVEHLPADLAAERSAGG